MSTVTALFTAFGCAVFVLGLQTLFLVPLAVYYQRWKGKFLKHGPGDALPSISVIVPAHNEEATIYESVTSILRSDYPEVEVIVVNDGSTDATEEQLKDLIETRKIVYLKQANGGKARALNAGIRRASGEVIIFTDADSTFGPLTAFNLARWFADPSVHAVSGNDDPLTPRNAVQKLLMITTHIGSGFIRRALSVAGVLPIISGNLGAVRKDTLEKVNLFSNLWGEDLDLTFKLHRLGARIIFDPEAQVLCHVPSTLSALWRQRVRWMRSFLKICARHRDMVFARRFLPFSLYLPINWLNMVVVPLLQIATVALLPVAVHQGFYQFAGVMEVIAYSGIAIFFGVSVFGILLDRSYRHLRFLPLYGWLIIPFSYFYNAVLAYAIIQELRGAAEVWHVNRQWKTGTSKFSKLTWTGAAACMMIVLFLSFRTDSRTFASRPTSAAITVATHFEAWNNPHDAIHSILDRRQMGVVRAVAVGAGRVEWNFFRWRGHEASWSNDQRGSDTDLLEEAVSRLHDRGKQTIAILDFYAPLYLHDHPSAAAVDADGNPSTEQVCFMDLTEGDYGKEVVAMATYLASHYKIDGISLTELEYSRYCYDDRCLSSFEAATHGDDWPRNVLSSAINRDDRTLGLWRSMKMAGFLEMIADSVHAHGKKLYVDVPAHAGSLSLEGLQSGLYYPRLLEFADGLIVWDYFYLDGRPPSSSIDIASFFTSRYDPDKIIMSIGLWGTTHAVSSGELSEAVRSSILGGARNIWITPNHLMTDEHWEMVGAAVTPRDSIL